MQRPARIAIAGGGTGGHVFPALSIAGALKEAEPGAEFLFFGTAGRIEADVVPQHGYAFRTIWISGFHRSFRLSNLLFPLKLLVALVQSWNALRAFRPDVVVGTGGYVCGPVLYVAARMGIPTVVHESNSYPGVTTRALAGRVTLVLTSDSETMRWLPSGSRVEVVGTPVRSFGTMPEQAQARAAMSLKGDDRVVLVLGGSQGARSVNEAIAAGSDRLEAAGISVIWQTGAVHEAALRRQFGTRGHLRIAGFIGDVGTPLAAADLVVSRAGASTLAELALFRKPAILVPYPFAAGDHQTMNAMSIRERGGAVVVKDDDATGRLVDEIIRLMQEPDTRARMAEAMGALSAPDAARTIAQKVLKQVKRS